MALIQKENKILLVKESNGRWSLPGGGLEVGESFYDGIKRELGEELGVKVLEVSPQPSFTWTLVDQSHQAPVPKLILCFTVKVDSFEFKNDSRESVEFNFFNLEALNVINLHPNTKELPKALSPIYERNSIN
jgi:ADP-ribose pyrophosphatase YjhB (NUDIX family)